MNPRFLSAAVLLTAATATAADIRDAEYGARLPGGGDRAALWTASSGWKIGRTRPVPGAKTDAVTVQAARGEAEAVQLVVTPAAPLTGLTIECADLRGPGGTAIPAGRIDVLRVRYVGVSHPTDRSAAPGAWPDPLPPLRGPLTLPAGTNQPFWIRVNVPRDAAAGVYEGAIRLRADGGWSAAVPLRVGVFGFALPDRPTCVSAFGLGHDTAFRYQGLTNDAQRREVLEKYLANFAAHRISPYDPAPLDPVRVTWPAVKPPPLPWADWLKQEVLEPLPHRRGLRKLVRGRGPRSHGSVSGGARW